MSETTENLQQLPLGDWHRALGARMVPFAGYEMPVQYEGVMAEHIWTRTEAGLFDVSHMGQLQLTGEGAADALERITPGNLSALAAGKIRYTLLLAQDGGILDDLMVTNAGDHLYLVVNGATKHDDIAYMQSQLPDGLTLNHLTDAALLALQGPKASEALAKLNIQPLQAGWPLPTNLYFMEAGPFLWNDIPLGISRSGYTGEDGFEISVPAEHAVALATALTELEEVRPIGLGARDSLRLEAGLPLYGHDMNPDILPVEANLSFALSKARREEGNFAGAERVLAQYPDTAATKRVGLFVDGRQPIREGATVIDDTGATIGTVTSGGFSPTLQRPIAMAYVPMDLSQTGTAITVEQRGKKIACTVADMPFVPHHYHRKPKS
ncbi:MAG: glycine cleavage system aminomethyltransferase GcvT [Sphingomonadales bacterium]|nr:glycine cleavage system aminomethyltransferase GcvT [Sphingomonadales bacterium]PIX66542.1 MAG: glycine cleavage system protein T [Sphingomonadales bacterium CG_4_10_14_3_um_filter_58_15]NCO47815.1 glycine cleavage system aminomethyltransferase GcvT [Sphingomonadales bacterium]NCP01079.1 glycine cleavage system aminomethyltransferase GcvT [Sphingomonadales bacterium]NCP27480.1 glycine cleavage system aminomethyltransferase GcvT [Sphingomonadales bacterium]